MIARSKKVRVRARVMNARDCVCVARILRDGIIVSMFLLAFFKQLAVSIIFFCFIFFSYGFC